MKVLRNVESKRKIAKVLTKNKVHAYWTTVFQNKEQNIYAKLFIVK